MKLEWSQQWPKNRYIGTQHGFDLSTGKDGRFFKRYLPLPIYEKYKNTYSNGEYENMWKSIATMCDLFHDLAVTVASHFNFTYKQDEEDGIREY